jgi:pimeloyl-ACP methyl ester carboxylesterase
VATSANTRELPAISDQELANYYLCKPGSTTDFRRLLEPAFSPDFKERYPERVTDYINYRATGKNCQTPAAFVRQVNALRNYSGTQYFSKVDPKETLFIRGSDDLLLDSAHGTILKQIVNEANHVEIKNLGHMVNIERPEALYECKTP